MASEYRYKGLWSINASIKSTEDKTDFPKITKWIHMGVVDPQAVIHTIHRDTERFWTERETCGLFNTIQDIKVH